MSVSDDEEPTLPTTLFQDPPNYYQPPAPPTSTTYTLLNGSLLHLNLVGQNPLWAHHIWQGARSLSHFLQQPPHTSRYLTNKTVLELGAGAGLPSIVASLTGATQVVCTDYPDEAVVQNLRGNIERNCPGGSVRVERYRWGDPAAQLLGHHPTADTQDAGGVEEPAASRAPRAERSTPEPNTEGSNGFDTLLLADLLYNHSCHPALLRSILTTLKRPPPSSAFRPAQHPPPAEPAALVFFSPYRPWLLDADLAFLELCREGGLRVRQVVEERVERVMFVDDAGDEEVRRRVCGFEVTWGEEGGCGGG